MQKLFIFLGILTLYTGSVHSVFANVSYTVSPLVIDIDVEARDIIAKEITVTNTGSQPVTLYPTVNNISMSEGGTIDAFLPPVESDRTRSLSSWIEISRLGIDMKVGESRVIPLTIRINPNPVPGTYHARISFAHGDNRDQAEKLVYGGNAPGTVISATVVDKKMTFLKLSKFVVDRFVTHAQNQAAVYTFKNPGDETVVPKGEIIVYDTSGKEVAAIPVNTENKAIAPGEEYAFTTEMPIDGLFGKYKAFLSVEYGDSQRASVQDTSFFYAIPLKKLAIIIGVLMMLVGIGAWHLHRKYLDTDEDDDSEHLTVHLRDTTSEARHHDIDLTKP